MPISQMFLPEFDHEMANTRKLLERVPEGRFDYKPHEKSMTLGRLAGHVAELPRFGTMILRNDGVDFTGKETPLTATSRKQLLETFDKLAAEARAALADASDDQLGKTWTLKLNGKQILAMPRVAAVRGMFMNHIIHHRAQLGVYLRLNNIEIPGMYGPSADEMKFYTAPNP
jgi:uncharacterized damage-inducible protein DinB